jgi:hypothetical protein
VSIRPLAVVRFKYRRPGFTAWTSTTWSGRVLQESETLVMQELRRLKPGSEIELVDLRWRT